MKNFHTHTTRCGHARGKDEDYIKEAVKMGFSTLGFSDHAPMIFAPEKYESSFRMPISKAEDYVRSLTSLREKYKDKIKIKIGFELEYYPKKTPQTLDFLDGLGFDYLILGQHFTSNEIDKGAVSSGGGSDRLYDFDKYIEQVLEGLSTGRFLYVAHPDVFKFIGSDEVYNERMEYFLKEIKRLGYPVEFNLLGYYDKRNYPDKRFWEIVSKTGNDVVIGFDAHDPWVLSDMDTFNSAKNYLASLGITPMNDEIDF